jgi:hypothetical protein
MNNSAPFFKYFFLSFFILINSFLFSQESGDSLRFSIRGFVDSYYGFDAGQPNQTLDGKRLPFLYNHTRHNSFSVNLAFIQLNVDHERFRSRLGVQGGTYVTDNYAGEPAMLRHFSEANVGVRLAKKKNLWMDVGILPSHIGFESAISTENVNLSRSLVAELSPYYMAGARLVYKTKKNWEFEALLCNGWQRIQRPNGVKYLSGGTRMTYETDRYKFNWSTFVGTDSPGNSVRMRYFSNLYSTWKLGKRGEMTLNADLGTQQLYNWNQAFGTWMGFAAVGRVALGDKWKIGGRGELYYDPERVMAGGTTFYEFMATGASINADLQIHEGVYMRWEARWLNYSSLKMGDNGLMAFQRNNFFFLGSLTVDINRQLK